jgi:hypothetical protein
MRNKIVLKGVPTLFFGTLLLIFLSASWAFSQNAEEALSFDNYTGQLSSLSPNSLAMQYTSVDRPDMIDGQESGSFQYRGSQKSKDESVYIEIRIERTTPRKARPEATKDIQYRAFQGFIISYDSIMQGKGDMGGRTITRNTLDKDEIPNLMKDSHAKGMAKMMGNYHLFEAQKVAGSIVHRQILVHAGNIFIHASYAQYDKIQNRPPDLALLVNEILAKLPKRELEKNVLVYALRGIEPLEYRYTAGILPPPGEDSL